MLFIINIVIIIIIIVVVIITISYKALQNYNITINIRSDRGHNKHS